MSSDQLSHPDGQPRSFWKIGHRGAPKYAPENTHASFEKAMELGADMVEFDVTLSSDGKPFVFHDENLNRTSNGEGRLVEKSTAEIGTLDAGSWFDEAFTGQRVPRLEDVLDAWGSKLALNVEIKNEATQVNREVGLLVHGQLQQRKLLSTSVISSFDHRILKEIRSSCEGARLAALFSKRPTKNEIQEVYDWGTNAIHLNVKGLKEADVEFALGLNLAVRVYTVNNACTIRSLRKWSVNGIFTDDLSLFD